MMCDSCEALMINGVHCHETGCPDTWKNHLQECSQCGYDFIPEDRDQALCNDCLAEVE